MLPRNEADNMASRPIVEPDVGDLDDRTCLMKSDLIPARSFALEASIRDGIAPRSAAVSTRGPRPAARRWSLSKPTAPSIGRALREAGIEPQ